MILFVLVDLLFKPGQCVNHGFDPSVDIGDQLRPFHHLPAVELPDATATPPILPADTITASAAVADSFPAIHSAVIAAITTAGRIACTILLVTGHRPVSPPQPPTTPATP